MIVLASLLAVAQATKPPSSSPVMHDWASLRGLYASRDPREGRAHAECEKIDGRLIHALQKHKFVCQDLHSGKPTEAVYSCDGKIGQKNFPILVYRDLSSCQGLGLQADPE